MDNQTEQNYLRIVTAEVAQAIAEALETLIHKKGFEVPIYMAAIGSNGYMYAVRYQQQGKGTALEARELAEHAPDEEGARFPINMLFVDCQGNGTRVLVSAPISEEQGLH
jgi:hypothetical protein